MLWTEETEVKGHSLETKVIYYQHDLSLANTDFDHLAEIVVDKFFCHKIILFPPFHTVLL